ncbi:MAG: putative heme d1 biosynthesis radical SAM protein NirJ2 [Thermodesulfovibrionia bacterium]
MSGYKPYLVSWNLTRRCNLFCPHCYLDADSRLTARLSELSTDEARFVIDELSYLNSHIMLILSGGEPMLREDIFEIVRYASDAGFLVVMGSNGTMLTRENLMLLKEAGLRGIGVSVDSHDRVYHDSFRGLDGAWEMAISALKNAKEIGIETQMDVTLTDMNIEELREFIELGASLSVKVVNFFFLICVGRAMKTDISSYNYESALKKIMRLSLSEKRLMVKARCAPHIYRLLYEEGFKIPEGTRGCLAGRHYIRIDAEGNVTPCPYMPLIVGNIRESSMVNIWEESPSLNLLRVGSYKGRCGQCEYIDICGGCRARALVESGDFMDEDPLCRYTPRDGERVRPKGTFQSELIWDEKAKNRIRNVPLFMKSMVIKVIEAKAKESGIKVITSELIDDIKSTFSMHK